jgi:hypothetical protein
VKPGLTKQHNKRDSQSDQSKIEPMNSAASSPTTSEPYNKGPINPAATPLLGTVAEFLDARIKRYGAKTRPIQIRPPTQIVVTANDTVRKN